MTSKYSESPVALMSCFTDLVCKVAARTHAYDLLPPREVEETGKWKEACVKKGIHRVRGALLAGLGWLFAGRR